MREQKSLELFSKGYNCAQAVLVPFCAENGLDKHTAFKLATGFGGGLRCGEVCGAVTGAVMAIGLKCGFCIEGDFEQKSYCNEKTIEFMGKFVEENGSVLCRDLLGTDIRTPADHTKPEAQAAHKTVCPKVIADAVRILENMKFNI